VDRFFPYDVDKRFLPVWLACGLKEGKDGVTVADDGTFLATLGWFRLLTTVDNVDGAHITRDYRWWTAVGPRMSLADDGLTFGTNAKVGVCVHFRERVSGLGPRPHSALTVTVADPEGLVALLGEADAR